jgi:hypothetical protein
VSDVAAPSDAADAPGRSAIFFDGVSSRRRQVTLTLGGALDIAELSEAQAEWTVSRWA